jgi:hypothetical protein
VAQQAEQAHLQPVAAERRADKAAPVAPAAVAVLEVAISRRWSAVCRLSPSPTSR